MNNEAKDLFLEQASEWVCESYSLAVAYMAMPVGKKFLVLDATLIVFPFPLQGVDSFSISAGTLLAGQCTANNLSKKEILKWLIDGSKGILSLPQLKLEIEQVSGLEFYSNLPHKETWFSELHLQVSGSRLAPPPHAQVVQNENALRRAKPPFDGIADLGDFLQLADVRINGQAPRINIRVLPPVDMDFAKSTLLSNRFKFCLTAHSKFRTELLTLAIREVPGKGVATRAQAGKNIKWELAKNGKRSGTLELDLANADSVQIMMTVGTKTSRRQWFLDPQKAANSRYVATQLFDKDLKQLKSSVLEPADASRFERGIASLLFLLGFSPSIQVETQAPDLLIATVGGKLAIIECTIKISDFQNKLGKLVDRRNDLVKTLKAAGHHIRVDAFLICALPRAQIAYDESRLGNHHVSLLCKEEIEQAFHQVRNTNNPDELLDRASAKILRNRDIAS